MARQPEATTTLALPSDRDGHLQSAMEPGMNETLDRLGEHVATLGGVKVQVGPSAPHFTPRRCKPTFTEE